MKLNYETRLRGSQFVWKMECCLSDWDRRLKEFSHLENTDKSGGEILSGKTDAEKKGYSC